MGKVGLLLIDFETSKYVQTKKANSLSLPGNGLIKSSLPYQPKIKAAQKKKAA